MATGLCRMPCRAGAPPAVEADERPLRARCRAQGHCAKPSPAQPSPAQPPSERAGCRCESGEPPCDSHGRKGHAREGREALGRVQRVLLQAASPAVAAALPALPDRRWSVPLTASAALCVCVCVSLRGCMSVCVHAHSPLTRTRSLAVMWSPVHVAARSILCSVVRCCAACCRPSASR